MSDTVKVRLMISADEGAAGDEVEVSKERAKVLLDHGAAQPVTKSDAKQVGADPDTAARSSSSSSSGSKKS